MTTKQKVGLFDAFKKSKRSAPSALVSKSEKKAAETPSKPVAKQQQKADRGVTFLCAGASSAGLKPAAKPSSAPSAATPPRKEKQRLKPVAKPAPAPKKEKKKLKLGQFAAVPIRMGERLMSGGAIQ